jgi:KAP family P-loop domain
VRLFPPPVAIDEKEGFSPEKDIFGREAHGQRLTNLIAAVSDPLVIAVDAPWGSGKTTFLKMWAGDLRKRGFPVIYFDAFENDYAEDAFTALAGSMISLADEGRKADTPAAKRFLEKAVSTSKILLRSGLKVGVKAGVKAATLGVLDLPDLQGLAGDLAGEAATLEDKYIGELLTKQKQQKDVMSAFRTALSELPALLTEPHADEASSAKPLIFIIDELDRCRPLFALELLERAKHFFAVPNVHFVLGTHLQQLKNSVVVAYGPNIDAATYLQKFLHLTLHLTDRERDERTVTKFVAHLAQVMEFKENDRQIASLVGLVADQNSLSLRTVERIMSVLAIALAYTPRNFFRPPPIIAGLSVLKVERPDLFVKAKKGTLSYAEVEPVLKLRNTDGHEKSSVKRFNDWWAVALDASVDQNLLQSLSASFFQYNIDNPRVIVPMVANDVLDRMQPQQTG